jgi:hypothetical protein
MAKRTAKHAVKRAESPVDAYESVASQAQIAMVKILDDALKSAKIPKKKRVRIAEAATFQLGEFLDHCPLIHDGRTLVPQLVFIEQAGRKETLHRQEASSFSWHEYALGNVEWFHQQDRTGEMAAWFPSEDEPAAPAVPRADAGFPKNGRGSRDMRSWAVADGHVLRCWIGGAALPDKPTIGIWATFHVGSTISHRIIANGKNGAWTPMRPVAHRPGQFGGIITLPEGDYDLEFRLGEEIFTGMGVSVTPDPDAYLIGKDWFRRNR